MIQSSPKVSAMFRPAILVAAALLPATVQAQPVRFADLAAIDGAVAQFTGALPGMPGAAQPVDRRLRLSPCSMPLSLAWRGQGRDTVVVQCPDAGSWRLFVPVLAASRQDAAGPAVQRGEAVTIAATGDGFTVSQPGEAMESGAVGAWIKVRTSARAEPIRARVDRPGLVVVPVE